MFRVQLRCKDAGLVIFWNAVTGSEMARLSAHEDLWVRFTWFGFIKQNYLVRTGKVQHLKERQSGFHLDVAANCRPFFGHVEDAVSKIAIPNSDGRLLATCGRQDMEAWFGCFKWQSPQLEVLVTILAQVRLWCLARPESDEEESDFDDMDGTLAYATSTSLY